MSGYGGVYRGICTNNADPEGFYRVRATVPQVFGDTTTETTWAWPVFAPPVTRFVTYSGGVAHHDPTYGTPIPGEGVIISFVGGDPEHPMWMGVWN